MTRRDIQSKYVYIALCFLLLTIPRISAQEKELSLDAYITSIKTHHPYVKIIQNKLLKAEYKFNASKGAFDPKFSGNWSVKDFKEKTYYDIRNAKIKIPTRIGLTPMIKYQNNSGYYLNPENNNPDNGLLGAGVHIPILRGLIIDNARREYRVQKLSNLQQTFTTDSAMNSIIANALMQYIGWAVGYFKLQAIDTVLSLRMNRYKNIIKMYQGGVLSEMDTLDAYTQFQKIQREYLLYKTEFNKKQYKLLNQLWDTNTMRTSQLFVPENIYTMLKQLQKIQKKLDIEQHNFIQSVNTSQERQKVLLQYYKEQFKPELNVEILGLNSVTNVQNNNIIPNDFFTNNFVLGLSFEIPLYYRKQLNYYKISKLEMDNLSYKKDIIKRKILTYYNTLKENIQMGEQQFTLSMDNIHRLKQLRDLEEEKYLIGESTLIKLNLRENKYIDEQMKTFDIFYKYTSQLITLGNLVQSLN